MERPSPDQPRPAGPTREQARADELAHPLTVTLFATIVTPLFFTIAVALAVHAFRPLVPPRLMGPWLVATLAFLLWWIAASIVLVWRRPGRDELLRRWAPLTRVVVTGSNLIVLATVWLFLPYGPTELRVVMAAFYVGQIATQVAYSPENVRPIRIGMVAIFGSAAFQLLASGEAVEAIVALFLLAFGVAMFVGAGAQLGYVRDAIRARFLVEDAQAETERAMASVSEARDAKTRFIAAASHDLGQPLQAAALFFDQVMRAPDAAERARAADGVLRAFAATDQLLSHMLAHLHLESGTVRPQLAPVALGPALARLAAQFEPAAQGEGIELRTVHSKREVVTDPALLDRALGNLIGNAIRHSRGSRVLLGVKRCHPAIAIWVIDNGVGVSRADLAYIFDDYYRGGRTDDATPSGFGLGLSSVRRISGLLGGSAGLDQRWAGGSAFHILLPADGSGAARPGREDRHADLPHR
jgi:signal transduction histidine kinase